MADASNLMEGSIGRKRGLQGVAVVGERLHSRCQTLSTSTILSFSPLDAESICDEGADALFSYWWECARYEDAGVEANDGDINHDDDANGDIRYLRCVTPPWLHMAVTTREARSALDWQPGCFLGMHASTLRASASNDGGAQHTLWFAPSARPVAWRLIRSPGGAIALQAPLSGGGLGCCGWTCPFEIKSRVVVPPCIDVSPLLAPASNSPGADRCATLGASAPAHTGSSVEPLETDNAERQLASMQQILDASQDVGYFFITGCDALEQCAAVLLQRLQFEATQGRHRARQAPRTPSQLDPPAVVTKSTLHTSTGTVKVSSSPLEYQQVVPPCWLRDATVQDAVLPYYDAARSVALALMESIAQHAIAENELFFLMRCVLYPPGGQPSPADAGSEQQQKHNGEGTTTYSGSRCEGASVGQRAMQLGSDPPVLEVHTDKSWLTILVSSSIHGLMFAAPDGDAFHPAVDRSVGALRVSEKSSGVQDGLWSCDLTRTPLVNIGDAFQMQSGGALLSRPHMATNDAWATGDAAEEAEGSLRVSVPLFVEPGVGYWPTPYDAADVMVVTL